MSITKCYLPGLSQARQDKGLSQQALGQALGVSRLTVLRWENGQATPDIRTVTIISDLLGISVADLLGL